MSKRQTTSKGQALVMITLALFAMVGIMGLAVDLGWSFFVKKQAQAAADAAALGAVQEAINRLGFTTSTFGGCPSALVDCELTAVDCSTFNGSSTSNLYNGCLYAANNGFSSATSRQKVTIQSYDNTSPPPTAPGVNNIVYWVTVRAVQVVPQLFSAILGNPTGVVSASATAAIVSQIVPGDVILLNRPGDCILGSNKAPECGVDVDLGGNSSISSPGISVVLSSTCNGPPGQAGCGNDPTHPNDLGTNYTGLAPGAARVTAGSITIQSPGAVDIPAHYTPTPVQSSNASLFQDPTQVSSTRSGTQPPLLAPNGVNTCALLNGQIASSGSGQVVAGPFNYFAYTAIVAGKPFPNGGALSLNATGGVKFDPSGTCPGIESTGGASQSSSAFPTYFFYGGLDISLSDVTFGPGQYVMVGAPLSTQGQSTTAGAAFADTGNNTVTGNSTAGTMFIFTAAEGGTAAYPGLFSQINAWPDLVTATNSMWQGSVNFASGASASVSLTGIKAGSVPAALNDYNGVLFWQDRANSSVNYNPDGTVNPTPPNLQNNRVPADLTSTTITLQAHPNLSLNGVIYQPRGANIIAKGNGGSTLNVQLISGAIVSQGGVNWVPLPSANPLLRYINALIQ